VLLYPEDMLDHSLEDAGRSPRTTRRAATVGAELTPEDKPKATLGETLVFLVPAFIAGVLLVATLSLVGNKNAP
jgi:hypothetical protein